MGRVCANASDGGEPRLRFGCGVAFDGLWRTGIGSLKGVVSNTSFGAVRDAEALKRDFYPSNARSSQIGLVFIL